MSKRKEKMEEKITKSTTKQTQFLESSNPKKEPSLISSYHRQHTIDHEEKNQNHKHSRPNQQNLNLLLVNRDNRILKSSKKVHEFLSDLRKTIYMLKISYFSILSKNYKI